MRTNFTQAVVDELAAAVPDELAGSGQPVLIGTGWDSAVYKWGDRCLRLSTSVAAAELLAKEYRWTERATSLLIESGFSVPTPRFYGESTDFFPYRWLLVDYVAGAPLSDIPSEDRGRAARDLATVFAALHEKAPPGAPVSPHRNVALEKKADAFNKYVRGTDMEALLRPLFERGVAALPWDREPVWCHGDLHARNILTAGGSISGIIDFGDLGAGDPAVDYAAFILAFTKQQREDARIILRMLGEPDDAFLWERARGWAAYMVAALASSEHEEDRRLAEEARRLLASELPD